MARPLGPMTAQIEQFLRMEARGEDHNDVLREVFGDEYVTDPAKKHMAEAKMCRWRKRPDAKAIWEDEVGSIVRRRLPGALSRIIQQIDGGNDWLANKAANDIVLLAKTIGIVKSDETALKVQIEGMPDIGSPDE